MELLLLCKCKLAHSKTFSPLAFISSRETPYSTPSYCCLMTHTQRREKTLKKNSWPAEIDKIRDNLYRQNQNIDCVGHENHYDLYYNIGTHTASTLARNVSAVTTVRASVTVL